MKQTKVIKWIITALLVTGIALISCDKNPVRIDRADNTTPGRTRQNLGAFGLEINDDAGTLTLYINGEPVSLGKSKDGSYKVLANINAEVDLTDINYTAQNCSGFDPNTPATKIRTLALTFTKKNNGGMLTDIFTSGLTTSNLGGANAIIDLGDNAIADGDNFAINYDVILNNCTTFSIFFDLEGMLIP